MMLGLTCTTLAAAADLDLTQVGSWPEMELLNGKNVAVVGRYALVTGGTKISPGVYPGLCVFDVGDAAPPRLVGSLNIMGGGPIAVRGNHAFVADWGRMLVVDISDPPHPRLVSVFDTPGNDLTVTVGGSYAYLGSIQGNEYDVRIINISDPVNPRAVGKYTTTNSNYGSALAADGAFLCLLSNRSDETGDTATLDVVDVHDPAAPRKLGTYETPGSANAMAVSAGRAYLAPWTFNQAGTWLYKVEVIDLSDPAGPKPIGAYSLTPLAGGDGLRSLCVDGHYLYTARFSTSGGAYRDVVDILDIQNPASPRRVGGLTSSWTDEGPYYSPVIAVAGGIACVGMNLALMSLDVSDPTAVRRLGTLVVEPGPFDVAMSGNYAVVADWFNGLSVLDASDPANMRRVANLKFPTVSTFRVVVSGNYAYVAGSWLYAIDVSDPAHPRRMSSYEGPEDVAVSGNLLCTVHYGAGLEVFDLAKPANPRRVGKIGIRYTNGGEQWIAMSGSYAFVTSYDYSARSSAMEVFDVSTPASPQWVGSYEPPGRIDAIAAAGNLAVVALSGTNSVDILDISDPNNPTWIASYVSDVAGYGHRVTILGNRAFIGGSGGLEVLDLSEPTKPRRIGGLNSGGRIAVAGDTIFVADGNSLSAVRLSTPALVLSGTTDVGGAASGVAVEGSTGYVAADAVGLRVLDLSNPDQPVALGHWDTDGKLWDVTVAGGRGYVAAGEAGLVILDVSNPANPQRVGGLDTPGDARAVLVSGSVAYVADGSEGVQVIDVSDPTAPRRMGGYVTSGAATGLALHGNHLLVACNGSGLLVLDVSTPANPQLVSTYNRGGLVGAVAVSGNHALVADGLDVFVVLDLTDPKNLKPVGSAAGRGSAASITVSGRFAYVADAQAGVRVYDLADPTQPRHIGGNTALAAYRLAVSGGRLFAAGGQRGLGMFKPFTPPLRLEALLGSAASNLGLRVDGPSGTSARLQRSTDLKSWQDWQTVTFGELPQTLTDPKEGPEAQRFYRTIAP